MLLQSRYLQSQVSQPLIADTNGGKKNLLLKSHQLFYLHIYVCRSPCCPPHACAGENPF